MHKSPCWKVRECLSWSRNFPHFT